MQISLIPNKRMQIPTETNGVFLRCKKSSRVMLPSFWTEIINKQERSTVDFECYDDHAMCCFRRSRNPRFNLPQFCIPYIFSSRDGLLTRKGQSGQSDVPEYDFRCWSWPKFKGANFRREA